jgi:hypothetical protein
MSGKAPNPTSVADPPVGTVGDADPVTGIEVVDGRTSTGARQASHAPCPRDALDDAERVALVALAAGQSVADVATLLRVSEETLGLRLAKVLAKLHRRCAAGRRSRDRAILRRVTARGFPSNTADTSRGATEPTRVAGSPGGPASQGAI